jgi:hypothetical protein
VSTSFNALLKQLAHQHAEELKAAVQHLSEENRRLSSELSAARWSATQAKDKSHVSPGGTLTLAMKPRGPDLTSCQGAGRPGGLFSIMPTPNSPRDQDSSDIAELPGMVPDEQQAVDTGSSAKKCKVDADVKHGAREDFVKHSMAADLTHEISNLDARNRRKMRLRLQNVLQLDGSGKTELRVGVRELQHALKKKRLHLRDERVRAVLKEIVRIAREIGEDDLPYEDDFSKMSFNKFVDLIMLPGLTSWVQDPSLAQHVGNVQEALRAKSVDEVICKITQSESRVDNEGSLELLSQSTENLNARQIEERVVKEKRKAMILGVVNNVAYATICLSILKFGLQMDIQLDRNDWNWYILEALFAGIFVLEFLVKNVVMGAREYFCGMDRYWNWLDAIITVFALIDSGIQLIAWGEESALPAAKLTMMVRMVRLSRIARLVKALRVPFLKDLGSMIVGLFLGAPWLIWVMVLLACVTYILALAMRQVVGPVTVGYSPDELVLDRCGPGDQIRLNFMNVSGYSNDDVCPIHKLLGEEFFHNVAISMFTVFRCLIGDCSTTQGQSLVVHLAKGYGWRFYVVYFVGMTTVIFGVFNIITAMIIDGTFKGLGSYHEKERRARLYEDSNVRNSIHALVRRMYEILGHELPTSGPLPSSHSIHPMSWLHKTEDSGMDDGIFEETVTMTETDYMTVMRDPTVRNLLEMLDVDPVGIELLFDMVDTDGNGQISVPEMVETFIKMRGELNKADIMANWFTLRSLHERFTKFQLVLLANQQSMMDNQSRLLGGM